MSGRSFFDREIERHVDRYMGSDEFQALMVRWARWSLQGFESGFDIDAREAFTKTVAARIRRKARRRIKFLGISFLWFLRKEDCWEEADKMVTEFLRFERLKFGDPRIDWTDGMDIADEFMEDWEPA